MSETKITRYERNDGDGWIPVSGFSYSDTLILSIATTDMTKIGPLSVGMRLKLTNDGSTKYYTIQNITTVSSNNLVSLSGTTALVSGTISDVYFSMMKQPIGYPQEEKYKFRAYLNQAQSPGTDAKINLNAESYDLNNNFDTSNGRFSPPVNGRYHFDGSLQVQVATSGQVQCNLRKNGANVSIGNLVFQYSGANQYLTSTVSDDLYLVVGDYIGV